MTNAADLSHRTVIDERVGAVALITLNRPERLNAWTDEMGERYRDLVTAADADPEVRAIVVTGAGEGSAPGSTSLRSSRRGRGAPKSATGRGGRDRSPCRCASR